MPIKSKKPIPHEELDKLNDGGSARYKSLGYIEQIAGVPFKLKDKVIYEINICPYCDGNNTYHDRIQKNGDIIGNVWRMEQFQNPQSSAFVSMKYDFCLDCRRDFVIEIYIFEKA